jgi:triosephosphate isomerase
LDRNVLLLNFKAYPESVGSKGELLAKIAEKVALDTGAPIGICPPVVYAGLAKELEIPVYGQNAEPVEPGARTGYVTLESMQAMGLKGTLINHSERRVDASVIKWIVERAQRIGFETCVCAKDVEEGKNLSAFKPTAVAVEPPELIGSGVSVSTARPEVVEESVKAIKAVSPKTLALCGAGVSNAADVKKVLELGAEGILLASAYVKAKDPEGWLRSVAGVLVAGYKE